MGLSKNTMPYSPFWARSFLAICVCLVGCSRSTPSVDEPTPDPPSNQNAAAPIPEAIVVAGESYTLPTDPEDLLDFINKMADSPPGDSVEEQTKHLKEMLQARALGAEKLLNLPIPNVADYATIATRAKLESLQLLAGLGESDAIEQLMQYATELKGSENAELSRIGQLGLFVAESLRESRLRPAGELQTADDANASHSSPRSLPAPSEQDLQVIPRLASLLESKIQKDLDLLGAASLVARDLLEQGHANAGAKALLLIGAAFRENPDKNLARMAGDSLVQGAIALFQEFQRHVIHGRDPAETIADFESQVGLLAPAWEDASVGDASANFAIAFEQTHGTDDAKPIWEILAKQWSSQDPKVSARESLLQKAERAATRRSLIGQELVLQGEPLLDESTFEDDFPQGDQAKTRRIVMIWSSQSELAMAELYNLDAILQGRGKRSYDVVLVCLDEDIAAARSAVAKRVKDWPVLFRHEQDHKGFHNPLAQRWGIDFVPYFLLADSSKVITHTCSSVIQLGEILNSE
jgi:hypothetical protein